MAVLRQVTGDLTGRLVELTSDVTVIGRSPECSIILATSGVSRRHAEIRRVGQGFVLVDLNSLNKTILNDTALQSGVDHPLKEGDRISIGGVEFVYHAVEPPQTKAPQPSDDFMVVTESDAGERPDFRTLEASRSSAVVSAVHPEVKLKAILEITRALSSELRIDAVAPKILDSLMEIFPGAERLFLMLQDPATKRLVRKAFKHRLQKRTSFTRTAPEDEVPTSISRSIVDYVLGQKKAVLSQDAGEDKNLPSSASIADLKIRSVMCVPLLTPDNKALGILQLDTSDRRQFNEDDLDVLAAVASQAAISIQNASMHESLLRRERLDRDLKLAEQVQKRFLPQGVPIVQGYEFFAHYQPTYEVGGDYYDFVPLPSSRMGLALGDVSGKGVSAALMMAKFSGDTRYCILTENDPAATATRLNGLLCAAGIEDKFITLSLSVLDAPSRKLTLASAGHNPVLIRRANGQVEELGKEISGVPLGIMDDSVYEQTEVQLEEGDVVVIYSDGVTDARSPGDELYDSKDNRRLFRRVAQSSGGPVAVGRSILQDIREFSAEHSQADDITLVCFGPTPGLPSSASSTQLGP
jgi:serine phosphatase RsbU (regulator of sigma subunit)/pSer/pThr/pTyr-binding forkhead associated (FHA) protein